MKLRPLIALLAITLPSYLVFGPQLRHIPTDLRDAVADGAFISLPGSDTQSNLPAVSAPAPLEMSSPSAGKSIYGSDDRLDYYEAGVAMQTLSNSVVSLWKSASVTAAGGTAILSIRNFGTALGLCPGQRFAEQPIGAFCSGTLVGEDVVMTAGHCIKDQAACANTKFVFGFALKKAGQYPQMVPVGDVYGCSSIIQRDLDDGSGPATISAYNGGPGPDFALVRLDRKVTGHAPLAIQKNAKPAAGDKLFVIGHPVGLPLKVAGSAKVRDASPKYFFKADLDTFGGNSGSAVFNAGNNQIAGILVRGDTDFVASPVGCKTAYVVAQDGGSGEAVTKISVVEKYLK